EGFARMKSYLWMILILFCCHNMLRLLHFLFAVVIGDLYDFHSFDFKPDIFAIFVCRYRIFVWLKNHAVWLFKVAGPLPFAIAFEFVVVTGKVTNIFQCVGTTKVAKTSVEKLRTD